MDTFRDPGGSWIFWVLVGAAVGVSAFFQISRDAPLKRRWWPRWLLVTTVLFGLFGWYVAGVPVALFLIASSILMNWLILRRTHFCDQCGRTVSSYSLFHTPARHCPECGASIGRAA